MSVTGDPAIASSSRSDVHLAAGAPSERVDQTAIAGVSRNMSAWRVIAHIGSTPVVWVSVGHPLPGSPSVLASAAMFDQTSLTAGLFNGPMIPGGTHWHNGNHVMSAAQP